jgi:glycosyltransferase involved in cell wall biosynthesis
MTAEPSRSQDHARVTICLICYQHAAFVQQALDAIAAQTCEAFKVIAIDDGSTDGTLEILQNAASGSLKGKLTVLTHPGHQNQGCYASYRECLRHVDTDYFMPHASDDFLEPDAVEGLIALLDANPNADFAYGPCKVVDAAGSSTGAIDGTVDIGKGDEAIHVLLARNPVREPTMFFRRHCRTAYLDHPVDIKFGDWYYHFLTFGTQTPLRYSTPYVNYRHHHTNTSVGRDAQYTLREIAAVFASLLHPRPPDPIRHHEAALVLAWIAFQDPQSINRAHKHNLRIKLNRADWTTVSSSDWTGLAGKLLNRLPLWAVLPYCRRLHPIRVPREYLRVLRRWSKQLTQQLRHRLR